MTGIFKFNLFNLILYYAAETKNPRTAASGAAAYTSALNNSGKMERGKKKIELCSAQMRDTKA